MRIRTDTPEHAEDLAEFLQSRVDAVVSRIEDDELEVSLLNSMAGAAMRLELFLRIRAWEVARDAAGSAELVDP